MCSKKHRQQIIRITPLIFATWFLIVVHVVGALYYDYDTTLAPVPYLGTIFYVEFAALTLTFILCIVSYLVLRRRLQKAQHVPFIIFTVCFVAVLLMLSYVTIGCYALSRYAFNRPFFIEVINKQVCAENGLPKFLATYHVQNSCCIFRDRCWEWEGPNITTYSCCPSILKCDSKDDWYQDKCLPIIKNDYNFYAKTIMALNLIGTVMILLLFAYYGRIFCLAKSKRRHKEEDEALDRQNSNHQAEGDGPIVSPQQSEPAVALCLCSC